MGRVRAVPRLCELYPGICLTTEEKAQKTLRSKGPPFTTNSVAIFLNYVYAKKLGKKFGQLVIPLTVIFPHASCEPTHNKCCGPLP